MDELFDALVIIIILIIAYFMINSNHKSITERMMANPCIYSSPTEYITRMRTPNSMIDYANTMRDEIPYNWNFPSTPYMINNYPGGYEDHYSIEGPTLGSRKHKVPFTADHEILMN